MLTTVKIINYLFFNEKMSFVNFDLDLQRTVKKGLFRD